MRQKQTQAKEKVPHMPNDAKCHSIFDCQTAKY
jgi:hypothetical protein